MTNNTINDQTDQNVKTFDYGDHRVVVDTNKNFVRAFWLCGCCRTYSSQKYNGYAICGYCARPKVADNSQQ